MIERREEWTAPWEVTTAVYIYKMENTADGDVERVGVRMGLAANQTRSSGASDEPSSPDDAVEDPSEDSSDDSGDPSFGVVRHGAAARREDAAAIMVGDAVQLSPAGEASYAHALVTLRQNGHVLPRCLAPGSAGEVLDMGQLPLSSIKRYRVRVLEGSGRGAVFWYPREALSVESIGVGRRWSVRDSVRSGAAGREQQQQQRALRTAEWEYTIGFQIPWILRKVLGTQVQLATTVHLDAENRVLETVMRSVPNVMNIVISESTTFRANFETGGTTWERKLTVSYPDWLPKFAERKVKQLYNEETTTATRSIREMFADMRARAPVMLASVGTKSLAGFTPGTGVFLEQLGLANSLRSGAMVSQAARQEV